MSHFNKNFEAVTHFNQAPDGRSQYSWSVSHCGFHQTPHCHCSDKWSVAPFLDRKFFGPLCIQRWILLSKYSSFPAVVVHTSQGLG